LYQSSHAITLAFSKGCVFRGQGHFFVRGEGIRKLAAMWRSSPKLRHIYEQNWRSSPNCATIAPPSSKLRQLCDVIHH
jgi:hypothetical protein